MLTGIGFASLSLTAEWLHSRGVYLKQVAVVDAASYLYPFNRQIREAPAHIFLLNPGMPDLAIPRIERALGHNPYSGDLNFALMKYRAQTGDQKGAVEAMEAMRRSVPRGPFIKAVLGSVTVAGRPQESSGRKGELK